MRQVQEVRYVCDQCGGILDTITKLYVLENQFDSEVGACRLPRLAYPAPSYIAHPGKLCEPRPPASQTVRFHDLQAFPQSAPH